MIEYERDVSYCKRSTEIEEVKVKSIEQGDPLDTIFLEQGWKGVARNGTLEEGDDAIYLPPNSVLPIELCDKMKLNEFLSKGKIEFKGSQSRGFVISKEKIKTYIPFILKWNDLSINLEGKELAADEVNFYFNQFPKIPDISSNPQLFKIGEPIVYSEKIHGIHLRTAILANANTCKNQHFVGSDKTVLEDIDNGNTYWEVAKKYRPFLEPGFVFYAEIFGMGIQKLDYNKTVPNVLFFAVSSRGHYFQNYDLVSFLDHCGLPHVSFHETKFESLKQIERLAEMDSELTDSHPRHGVIITSLEDPSKMVKCINIKL